MAKTVEVKIPADIEFRVISNFFGLLIASAGLLAGTMVRLRSFDYWREDIIPLTLVCWLCFRIFRNLLSTLIMYQDAPPRLHPSAGAARIAAEPAVAGHISATSSYSPEQVIEEVAKRIESQKQAAIKNNKFTN